MQNIPITSSSRAPDKQRPRPLPKAIKAVIVAMVSGRPGDPDAAPLTFIEAAKLCGVAPDHMRRWLDRPEARAFLRSERTAWRESICAGNENALKRVRDHSENAMAVVRSVQALEGIGENDHASPGSREPSFGFVICVPATEMPSAGPVSMAPRMHDVAPVVDMTPTPEPFIDAPSPAFKPRPRPIIDADAEAEPAERQIETRDPTAFKPPR